MNISLHKLRRTMNLDKFGQGSLVGIAIATVIISVVVTAGTAWYLSMRTKISKTNDFFTALSAIYTTWNSIQNVDYTEQIPLANTTKSEDIGGKYTVTTTFSKEGQLLGNDCHTEKNPDNLKQSCMNTTITVKDKDGNTIKSISMVRTTSQNNSVNNDSYPSYTIANRYNTETDSVQALLNGNPKSAWTEYVFKSNGTKSSVDDLYTKLNGNLLNSSYPNHRVKFQFEQERKNDGTLKTNQDGSPKMIIGAYDNGASIPVYTATTEEDLKIIYGR